MRKVILLVAICGFLWFCLHAYTVVDQSKVSVLQQEKDTLIKQVDDLKEKLSTRPACTQPESVNLKVEILK